MQLDRTHVAIRVRTLSEIGDLSLVMIRRYPKAFLEAFFLGAAFWILADLLLLGWLPLIQTDSDLSRTSFADDQYRYLIWMATLVFLQTPIAGCLTTYMLGQSIFEQQISLRKAVREVRPVFWQLVRVLGIRRLAIPAMFVAALQWHADANVFFDFFVPVAFLVFAALIRSSRPFVAEMILLERCPLRSKRPEVITLGQRSKALHSPMSSELGGRFLAVAMTLTVLLACLFFALTWSRGMAWGNWSADAFTLLVFYPLALWLVASLSVVIKLLSYLDARIRLEGWEVELAIRAEAIRQFGEDSMSVTLSPNRSTASSAATLKTLLIWTSFTLLSFAAASPLLAASTTADARTIADARTMNVISQVATPETSPVAGSPWFDSAQQELRSIELHDDRVDSKNRDSRWLRKAPTNPAPQSSPPSATQGVSGLGYAMGWLMLIAFVGTTVALLMYVFGNSPFDFRTESPAQSVVTGKALDEQTKQRIAELPAELRDTTISPRAELERLMTAGEFDRAVIFLYGHQLLMLDRVGWLRLSRWKTNNQYLRETRQSDLSVSDQLRDTVAAFERSYFGKHELSRQQFERLWQENLVMEATITARGVTK